VLRGHKDRVRDKHQRYRMPRTVTAFAGASARERMPWSIGFHRMAARLVATRAQRLRAREMTDDTDGFPAWPVGRVSSLPPYGVDGIGCHHCHGARNPSARLVKETHRRWGQQVDRGSGSGTLTRSTTSPRKSSRQRARHCSSAADRAIYRRQIHAKYRRGLQPERPSGVAVGDRLMRRTRVL
jgi:hypothetical protein